MSLNITKEDMYEAISKSFGNIYTMEKIFKCNYRTIKSYIKKHDLEDHLNDQFTRLADVAWRGLAKHLHEGNLSAIMFVLNKQERKENKATQVDTNTTESKNIYVFDEATKENLQKLFDPNKYVK